LRVNTYTTGGQVRPRVASDASGNFVVVWESPNQDGDGAGVFGQRVNAAGVPQGIEFQANSYTTGPQMRPAAASDANGNVIVVWDSFGQDGSDWATMGQRMSAAGLPLGSEFQVNSYTTNRQYVPAVASDASGDFVVAWVSYRQDGSQTGIFGQRFDATGLPQGSEFQVNSYTTDNQVKPAVASDANGNFVIVWQSSNQGGPGYGVFGQRFAASGLPQGGEFPVHDITGLHRYPAVASDPTGNFVVAWESVGRDGSGTGIFARRFDASGVPQGSAVQVNTYTTGNQRYPAAASDAYGAFVVAWTSYGQDGSGYGIFGQRFNAAGLPQGSEFQVNSYTTLAQSSPAVASAPNGNFVVVWPSDGQDGSGYGIFGQRYGDLIFRDGFE
jgi:hypothetical protein